jgi:hypothetical protein
LTSTSTNGSVPSLGTPGPRSPNTALSEYWEFTGSKRARSSNVIVVGVAEASSGCHRATKTTATIAHRTPTEPIAVLVATFPDP